METEMRKKTQKLVQRLILPKVEGESADVFLRRMDAHNNTPPCSQRSLSSPYTAAPASF